VDAIAHALAVVIASTYAAARRKRRAVTIATGLSENVLKVVEGRRPGPLPGKWTRVASN
jgi:hypothetical protein